MIKILQIVFLLCLFLLALTSCNPDGMDTTELWKKSQSRGDIVERSGTTFRAGSNQKDLRNQMIDAQNRLRTGGGLFGKKGLSIDDIGKGTINSDQQTTITSVGFPINPYLWKGSLDTISFMPLVSADPMAGIIITDWYTDQKNIYQRCKLNIFIKGVELKTDNLKVNSFCQTLNDNNNWVDQKVNNENNIKLENAILNKAKKIKLSQS